MPGRIILMLNVLPDPRTANDIEKYMDRILRELGNPEPPLSIDNVLRLLELDRQYYSALDESFLREVAHRIKVAGKQLVARPGLLIDVIKKADLKAFWLPDSAKILIDANLHRAKHKWTEGHEIAHSVIPWHKQFCLGDQSQTLSMSCREQIENEANFGGGHLLFLGDFFRREIADHRPSFATIRYLADRYQNSITSTLYRFIEQANTHPPMFGAVCGHWYDDPDSFDLEAPCDHLIFSDSFRSQFSNFDQFKAFELIRSCCAERRGGPLGEGIVTVLDDNDEAHYFHMECFSNTHQILVLAVHQNPVGTGIYF